MEKLSLDPDESMMDTGVSKMSTKQTELSLALAAWRKCGLTPAQTRTELERFAAETESERDRLRAQVKTLREALEEINSATLTMEAAPMRRIARAAIDAARREHGQG